MAEPVKMLFGLWTQMGQGSMCYLGSSLTKPGKYDSTIRVWQRYGLFGQQFVKWFALCYRTLVCPVLSADCLSVTLVYCGQTVGRIKMKLGMQVGLGPGHIVLDGDPAPPLQKGHIPPFSAHVCCGQVAGWIKMPLGTEVGLGPGDIVLDGDPAPPPQKGHIPPIFGPCLLWPSGWMD